MTQVQPPAEPAAAPLTPAQSSAARLAEAFPDGPQLGDDTLAAPVDPNAPAVEEPGIDLFDDAAIDGMNFDGLQYRDGKKLREEIVKARDTYKPFRDALAGLDDTQRQQLLDNAPNLGPDLAALSAVSARLDPGDRAYFQNAMSLLASGDPADLERGAQMLADGAQSIRDQWLSPQNGGTGAPPAAGSAPMPDWAQPADGAAPPDPDSQPITRADLRAWQAENEQRQMVQQSEAQILAQARDLGYDPDAPHGSDEANRFKYLLTLATGQSGGDLAKAHEGVERLRQAAIDDFVRSKEVDASRPAATAVAGTAPVETQTLETMVDARQAASARLDGLLGPDPRKRGVSD